MGFGSATDVLGRNDHPWVKLEWDEPVTVNRVVVFDRACKRISHDICHIDIPVHIRTMRLRLLCSMR